MAEQIKPDYVDRDWTALIKDREAKWDFMWENYKKEGQKPIPLWQTGAPYIQHKEGFVPQILIHPIQKEKRGIIIVCAGGAFRFKSSNEAKPVAEFFHNAGLNAVVLDYSVDHDFELSSRKSFDVWRAAQEDALRTIRYLRFNASNLGIQPEKIAIGGFSAGGTVASLAATGYDYGNPDAEDPIDRVSSRPNAVLPIYSARTSDSILGSADRRRYDFATQKILTDLSTDINLKKDSPPFFLAQTAWDDPRPMLRLGINLANRGINFEIHIFEDGPHGAGLYDGKDPDSPYYKHTSHWAELAYEWLIDKGF